MDNVLERSKEIEEKLYGNRFGIFKSIKII
jgi:hypothetical protein